MPTALLSADADRFKQKGRQVNLPELLADYERRATEAEGIQATAPVAGFYRKVISEVEELDGVATRSDTPDQWLTVKETVKRTGYSRSYFYTNADKLPFIRRNGGGIRISERDLTKWMAR